MSARILHFLSLFFLMLITGVFWGTWFTLTRAIEQFPPDEFIHIGKVIIANVATPMRVIMPLGIILTFATLWKHRQRTTGFYFGITSLTLILAVLLITLIVLVPIDNNIKEWSSPSIPNDWKDIRNKWQTFHALRTFLSLASFACFSVFVVSDRQS